MKKSIVFFVVIAFYASSSFADNLHKVIHRETVWFLSQLYYDDGSKYTEILEANGMKSPSELVEGMELVIPLPKFSNKDASYEARYQTLLAQKTRKLANIELTKKVSQENTPVVTEQPSVSAEPVKPPVMGQTPVQKAIEELRKAGVQE